VDADAQALIDGLGASRFGGPRPLDAKANDVKVRVMTLLIEV